MIRFEWLFESGVSVCVCVYVKVIELVSIGLSIEFQAAHPVLWLND